jgi:hypothetical protein
MIKTWRKKWARYVAYIRNAFRFWLENRKEGDHYENLDVDGRIILRWFLDRTGWYGLD